MDMNLVKEMNLSEEMKHEFMEDYITKVIDWVSTPHSDQNFRRESVPYIPMAVKFLAGMLFNDSDVAIKYNIYTSVKITHAFHYSYNGTEMPEWVKSFSNYWKHQSDRRNKYKTITSYQYKKLSKLITEVATKWTMKEVGNKQREVSPYEWDWLTKVNRNQIKDQLFKEYGISSLKDILLGDYDKIWDALAFELNN